MPATECPRISPAFLEEQRRIMGAWWFQQEYGCSFEANEASLFSLEQIDSMVDPTIQPMGW